MITSRRQSENSIGFAENKSDRIGSNRSDTITRGDAAAAVAAITADTISEDTQPLNEAVSIPLNLSGG